jgi:ABC-type uncharacterized transport system permease subunit
MKIMSHNNHMIKPSVIFIVAGIHFLLCFVFFFISFGISMDRFDTGRSLTLIERGIQGASEVLFFPLGTLFLSLAPKNIPNAAQYIPFILNSLLWGICVYVLLRIATRRKT